MVQEERNWSVPSAHRVNGNISNKCTGKRWCLFYTAICFSGAASGLISGAVIAGLEGVNGRRGWRWLFLIEGIITMGFAIFAAFVLPDYPHTKRKRFSEAERNLAVARILHDRALTVSNKKKLSPLESVKAAVVDLRLYLFILVFMLLNGSTTVSYFIPTVLASMGYSGVQKQWMTVPIWAVSSLLDKAHENHDILTLLATDRCCFPAGIPLRFRSCRQPTLVRSWGTRERPS